MFGGVVFVTRDPIARIATMTACTSLGNTGYEAFTYISGCIPADIRDDMLYLVDDVQTARGFVDAGAKVCGFLHGNNRQETFPGFKYVFDEVDEVDADSYRKAWERLSGLPWTIAKTDRLLIRETTIDDLDALYEIYSEPQITRFQDGLFEDRDAEKRYMEEYIKNVYGLLGCGIWSLVRLEDGVLVGRAGLSVANGFDSAELGFTIGVPWQRQGYAYEACSQILLFGEWVLGLSRVYAKVKKGNTASAGLCEKLGFERMTDQTAPDGYERYVRRMGDGKIHNGS